MPKKTVISFLLDETGSMNSIKDDTIGGFNQYVDSLKGESIEFSLVKFDSNRIEKVYTGVPIGEVAPLTNETYQPGAATPLIDAAVKIIKATADRVGKKKVNVLVVIQTDGHENASREHTLSELQDLVKEKTAAGWEFVFLGAGIDAFNTATSIGISADKALSYGRGVTTEAFAATAANTMAYARGAGGQSLGFSDDQREAAQDKYHPTDKKAKKSKKSKPIVDDFSL